MSQPIRPQDEFVNHLALLSKRRYVAGQRQGFPAPKSSQQEPQERHVQWPESQQHPRDYGIVTRLSEVSRISDPAVAERARLTIGESLGAEQIQIERDVNSTEDDTSSQSELGSQDNQEAPDLLPLLQQIVTTNNHLYDFLLRATSVRRSCATQLSSIYEESWPGSNLDLEGAVSTDEHEQAVPEEQMPSSSRDESTANSLAESNVPLSSQPDSSATLPVLFQGDFSAPNSAQMVPHTKWLVPYGTYLPLSNTRSPSIQRKGSTTIEEIRIERPATGYPTDADESFILATDDDINSDREARRNLIKSATTELLMRQEFSEPRHILRIYPLRCNLLEANRDDSIDAQNLVRLCDETRVVLQKAAFNDNGWNKIPTFMPLIEERLLCCTGDPSLRLDACWARRPRGTFLDFGWTRSEPQMPSAWSFFAYCKPDTLLSVLIEIMEVVSDMSSSLEGRYGENSKPQAWKNVTVGHILRSCYMRRLFVQPDTHDMIKYEKHLLFVLAAMELTNTFFKSTRTEIGRLHCFIEENQFTAEALLAKPLSDIANQVLCPRRTLIPQRLSGMERHEVFSPEHFKLRLLMELGFLKIEWTEYLDKHLTFDSTTLTVYVYWFASHIDGNSSFHLCCDLIGCMESHLLPLGHGRSRTVSMNLSYQQEVIHSYRWIFNGAKTGADLERYYDLPLPWWLCSVDQPNDGNHGQGSNNGLATKGSKTKIRFTAALGKILDFVAGKLQIKKLPTNQRPTIRTLVKDLQGHKCELPIDCLKQIAFRNTEYGSDEEDENLSKTLSYMRYPILAPRIKPLVDYMEKQKPKGFRALWKDKRDSNAWYTFWAAVIFGFGALLFALASLAVSSAQTWVSFRALGLQVTSTTSSSAET